MSCTGPPETVEGEVKRREEIDALLGSVRQTAGVCELEERMRAHHPPLHDHSVSTTYRSVGFALEYGMTGDDLRALAGASLLHDAGQLSWPSEFLRKRRGDFTDDDFRLMRLHPYISYRFVRDIDPEMALIAAAHHVPQVHGYPARLRTDDLRVHILSLSDKVDALLQPRRYRLGADTYSAAAAARAVREQYVGFPGLCERVLAYNGLVPASLRRASRGAA